MKNDNNEEKNSKLIESLITTPKQHYQANYRKNNKPKIKVYNENYKPTYRKNNKPKKKVYNENYYQEHKETYYEPVSANNKRWIDELFNADKPLNDQKLKNANHDIIAAVQRFILIRGFRKDSRKEPQDLIPVVNEKEILDRWKECMGRDVDICVCAECGKRDFMAKSDGWKKFDLSKTKRLQIFRAKKDKIPKDKNSSAYKAKNLVELNNNIYHFAAEGIQNGKVIICKRCYDGLQNAYDTKTPPKYSIAHYDLGKYPSHLISLTPVEKIAISRAIIFAPTFHMKPIVIKKKDENGKEIKLIFKPKALKGHCFCIKVSKDKTIRSITNDLPRTDISQWMQIKIYGARGMVTTAKALNRMLKDNSFTIRMDVIMDWLNWLRDIGNPYYQEDQKHKVTIPKTQQEIQHKQTQLDAEMKKIFDDIKYCDSREVNQLAEKTRAGVTDSKDALNEQLEGDIIRNVFISD
ncbi:MAG: hypothetical protein GY739_10415, partial [Mesoflavibacter sp.]|nr:hypothetical protein [Mesoflavibacter sp.]